MKISKIYNALALECVSGNPESDFNADSCYIGDLLSLAMSHVKSGTVWITIQTNINVAAVASLGDAACVIIVDGFSPDENTLAKAEAEGITIFTTGMSAYETAKKLAELGL